MRALVLGVAALALLAGAASAQQATATHLTATATIIATTLTILATTTIATMPTILATTIIATGIATKRNVEAAQSGLSFSPHRFRRRAPPRLVLEIDISKCLPVVVAHDKTRSLFFD